MTHGGVFDPIRVMVLKFWEPDMKLIEDLLKLESHDF